MSALEDWQNLFDGLGNWMVDTNDSIQALTDHQKQMRCLLIGISQSGVRCLIRRLEMNKDWNSSTSDYGGKQMDVKGWNIVAASNKCIKRMEMVDITTGGKRHLCMESDLCDCIEANCPIKIPRPDPAEVERLVDKVINLAGDLAVTSLNNPRHHVIYEKFDKARSELLKLVGG